MILSEINPATAESPAPTAKAIPLVGNPSGDRNSTPIKTARPIAIGITILNSLLKNAVAPSPTALEISSICCVPGFCLDTHVARTAAMIKAIIDAPTGIISLSVIY